MPNYESCCKFAITFFSHLLNELEVDKMAALGGLSPFTFYIEHMLAAEHQHRIMRELYFK